MKGKVSVLVMLFSLVLVSFTVQAYAAPPVDGFMGVSWGAGRDQVAKVMADKGFVLYKELVNPTGDVYRGTFSGHPALLEFTFENNVFYSGSVYFMEAENQVFGEMMGLLKTKYGPPDNDVPYDGGHWLKWANIPTTAMPAGKVTIGIVNLHERLWVYEKANYRFTDLSYSIGVEWARLKNAKDI